MVIADAIVIVGATVIAGRHRGRAALQRRVKRPTRLPRALARWFEHVEKGVILDPPAHDFAPPQPQPLPRDAVSKREFQLHSQPIPPALRFPQCGKPGPNPAPSPPLL